jgi:hypothetical protein
LTVAFLLWLYRLLTNPHKPMTDPFVGQPLRYLIGTDDYSAVNDGVLEVSYDESHGKIAYCNLFNEKYSEQSEETRRRYGPYLHDSDTADEYDEGQIDPNGPGWVKNLTEQFERRQAQGFEYVELDNPDAYAWRHVQDAISQAMAYNLKVIAKNPGICFQTMADRIAYVQACHGMIVERGAGSPIDMDNLRKSAGLPDMMVWFVFFDKGHGTVGRSAAHAYAMAAGDFKNMGVTYSQGGEYTKVEDVLWPLT